MSMPSKPFDNLALDEWFKAVTYAGGLLIIFSIFIPVQVVTNAIITIFGSGMFVFGLGRWKNQKTHSTMGGGGIISVTKRTPDKFGLLLEGLGLLIIIFGFFITITEHTNVLSSF